MSKEQLTLSDIAFYLPYKLRVQYWDRNVVMNAGQGSSTHWIGITALLQRQGDKHNCYPILKPLSDLKKDAKFLCFCENELCNNIINLECWVDDSLGMLVIGISGEWAIRIAKDNVILMECPVILYNWLIEHHYDVNNLICAGLAVDINTTNK